MRISKINRREVVCWSALHRREMNLRGQAMQAVDTSERTLVAKAYKKSIINQIIFDNREVKLSEIAEDQEKVSKKRVGHTVHDYMDERKVCSKLLVHELTIG